MWDQFRIGLRQILAQHLFFLGDISAAQEGTKTNITQSNAWALAQGLVCHHSRGPGARNGHKALIQEPNKSPISAPPNLTLVPMLGCCCCSFSCFYCLPTALPSPWIPLGKPTPLELVWNPTSLPQRRRITSQSSPTWLRMFPALPPSCPMLEALEAIVPPPLAFPSLFPVSSLV